MTGTPVSVVVVSRHRKEALLRCVRAVSFQDYPDLELIIVADPEAVRAVEALRLSIKCLAFDEENISAARNIGLNHAAGEVVAFIDDDAVPEPTWISRLAAPFADPAVAQAGGFVRGRNGFSMQWRAMEVDASGRDHPVDVPTGVSLHAGTGKRTFKLQGTNCAFRRSELAAIGGFDPAYRFYLEDADVSLRLAERGGLTAIVTNAEVQHGFAESARRRADRTPTDLFEIGASHAVFLRRHYKGKKRFRLTEVVAEQRSRLVRQMVDGHLEPREVGRLIASLRAGIRAGLSRPLESFVPLAAGQTPFLSLKTGPRQGIVLSGWVWWRKSLLRAAEIACRDGKIATILLFAPSPRRHRQRFVADGIWLQEGGVHGRSEPSDPKFRFWRKLTRLKRETQVISRVRPIS
jgi:cellulose synthase/poly-beta-1,6-N-acetylglucosamine synthase-like glycosyltransferase